MFWPMYQMFWPMFARGPWLETFKASFSRTNQIANKRGRQKKCVKIFLDFTYLHKTKTRTKLQGIFPIIFEDVYTPDVWVSRFGCSFKCLTVWLRYSVFRWAKSAAACLASCAPLSQVIKLFDKPPFNFSTNFEP